ncbi:MAG: leucine-rich repeat domain-containing protein [Promethearchaeota archaeon]
MAKKFVKVKGKKYYVNWGKLDLSEKEIADISEIEGLETLISLKRLNLSDNQIEEIKGLETLTNLKILELGSNAIFEITGLERLINLESLDLSGNRIEEIEGLEHLAKLRELNLRKNPIRVSERRLLMMSEQEIVKYCQEKLKMDFVTVKGKKYYVIDGTFNLSDLKITDIAEIKGLDQLIHIQRLILRNNKITEIKGLEHLTNLHKLCLGGNLIVEINGLDHLTNLQKLYLNLNQIEEIKGLENLTNLQKLDLSYNQITKVEGMEQLTQLQELCLGRNHIEALKGLESLTNLKVLKLSNNQIKEIKGLESLTNLKVLKLGNNQIKEIKGLDNLTSLKVLDLRENQIEEIKGLEHLLTELKELDLSENPIRVSEQHLLMMSTQGVVKYLQEKAGIRKVYDVEHILQEMKRELEFSLFPMSKILGRFFDQWLDDFNIEHQLIQFSKFIDCQYQEITTPLELLDFIDDYYTVALLWPCHYSKAAYLSREYRVLSCFGSNPIGLGRDEIWGAVSSGEAQMTELWEPYSCLLDFDHRTLEIIENMTFRKKLVSNWVEKTTRMYERINRTRTYLGPSGASRGLEPRVKFLERYILGDRIAFYGKLRKYMAKELKVSLKSFSTLESSYSDFWKEWMKHEIYFESNYAWSMESAEEKMQNDPLCWLESDYYDFLAKAIIEILEEILKRLEMDYSEEEKLHLCHYFWLYFDEWTYNSFRRCVYYSKKYQKVSDHIGQIIYKNKSRDGYGIIKLFGETQRYKRGFEEILEFLKKTL